MLTSILQNYKDFSDSSLSFIPSENMITSSITKSIPMDLYNRYCFDAIGENEIFPASSHIRELHNYVIDNLKQNLGVEYVNIDGISGLNLMTMVSLSFYQSIREYISYLHQKEGIMLLKMLETLGYKVYEIPFGRDGDIDQDIMLEDIKKYNISMVYIDQMMGNRLYDFSNLKQKLTKDCIIYYDISHNMAYFFQSDIKNPLEFGFDCFGGSTHKTFPGGHKAIFCTNDVGIYKRIGQTTKVFVSHTHTYDLAILARVLDDMKDRWDDYISTITKITKLLRGTFLKMGFECIDFSDTQNHQIMVSHPTKNVAELNKKFTENGILFNYLILGDKKILRIGVQEFAYMQPTTDEIMIVVKYILQIYSGLRVDRKIISALKNNLLK